MNDLGAINANVDNLLDMFLVTPALVPGLKAVGSRP